MTADNHVSRRRVRHQLVAQTASTLAWSTPVVCDTALFIISPSVSLLDARSYTNTRTGVAMQLWSFLFNPEIQGLDEP